MEWYDNHFLPPVTTAARITPATVPATLNPLRTFSTFVFIIIYLMLNIYLYLICKQRKRLAISVSCIAIINFNEIAEITLKVT